VVLAQVADLAAVLGRLVARSTHERAPAHFSRDEPTARRLGVGAAHRPDRHAERLGEVAVRRQPRTLSQLTRREILGQGFDDRAVARPLAPGQPRVPDCHGDNIAVDSQMYQL
jgi:hypothetical protein